METVLVTFLLLASILLTAGILLNLKALKMLNGIMERLIDENK